MSAFTVTVVDEVTTRIGEIARAAGNLEPAFQAIAGLLADLTEEAFAQQAQPGGAAWAPHAASTRRKRGAGARILQDTGRLAGSVHGTHGPDFAQLGVAAVYAAIHQFGGNIEMPARSQQAYFRQAKNGAVGNRFVKRSKSNFAQSVTIGAHQIPIPARPYMPITGPGGALTQPAHDGVLKILERHFGTP